MNRANPRLLEKTTAEGSAKECQRLLYFVSLRHKLDSRCEVIRTQVHEQDHAPCRSKSSVAFCSWS